MNLTLPGSSVHGILQSRILEWVDKFFSRGSTQSRDSTWASCIAERFFTIWTTREPLTSLSWIEIQSYQSFKVLQLFIKEEMYHVFHILGLEHRKSGLPGWLTSKESVWDAGDTTGSIPGLGRSIGGMATYSSILALENPMDRGAWQATVHSIAQSQTWLKWLSRHA